MATEGEVQRRQDEEDEEDDLAAEMERMIALQEEDQFSDNNAPAGENENIDVPIPQDDDDRGIGQAPPPIIPMIPTARSYIKIYYTPLSFAIAAMHILYILRTRKQVYLALLYLTSSKVSYIALGNAVLAFFLFTFNFVIQKFLNGLRFIESETITDRTRWNVTETCLALTMFRQELNIGMVGMFLVCILSKSLHLAVDLRGSHLRMTEEVFYYLSDDEQFGEGTSNGSGKVWWVWRTIGIFLPQSIKTCIHAVYVELPRLRSSHLKFCLLVNILHIADLVGLTYCATHLLESGPSAHILFGFEAAILLASIISIQALYGIHFFDGVVALMQRIVLDKPDKGDTALDQQNTEEGMQANQQSSTQNRQKKDSFILKNVKALIQHIAFFWRDHRATASFAVELMAVAATFLFSLILFVVVFTIYGLPINIIRDLYVAYSRLRSRLSAFASYRRLTSNMNTRFKSITTEEQLEQTGHTCIICRDSMDAHGVNGECKILPICGHAFHKHCLREWLTQQQTCPTCRGDIQKNEDRARAEEKRRAEEERNNDNSAPPEDVSRDTDIAHSTIAESTKDADNVTEGVDVESRDIVFPCLYLYKVVSLRGALVVSFNNPEDSQNTHQKVLRVIQTGKLVACSELKWQSWDNVEKHGLTTSCAGAGMFLKSPDGWIQEHDVSKILELHSK